MYLGDFAISTTFDFHFTTRQFSTGAPFTLAGTPSLAAYEDDSVTQITAGLTLTANFDSVTGLNHVRVVATGANGYETGKSYSITIAAGTVDSVSVVGEVVGRFTIERAAAITHATVGLTAIEALVDDLESRIGTPSDLGGGATVAANLSDIEAQTDDIGAAGAGLTAVPWNAAWDAEVESEVADGLAVYDPPTRTELTSDINSVLTAVDAVDNFVDTEVAAILAAVDTEVAAILALLDDARAEPGQGAPPVNPDAMTKLDYLYKSWRNKKDNDGSTTQLYADDGTTVDQKQTTSEAAGTVTKGEWVTGP